MSVYSAVNELGRVWRGAAEAHGQSCSLDGAGCYLRRQNFRDDKFHRFVFAFCELEINLCCSFVYTVTINYELSDMPR
jgi:hypothetical protein